jgi:hypothetical protein
VEELLAFSPRGGVDDQVDAFCQGVLWIEAQFWRGRGHSSAPANTGLPHGCSCRSAGSATAAAGGGDVSGLVLDSKADPIIRAMPFSW